MSNYYHYRPCPACECDDINTDWDMCQQGYYAVCHKCRLQTRRCGEAERLPLMLWNRRKGMDNEFYRLEITRQGSKGYESDYHYGFTKMEAIEFAKSVISSSTEIVEVRIESMRKNIASNRFKDYDIE